MLITQSYKKTQIINFFILVKILIFNKIEYVDNLKIFILTNLT